MMIAIKLLVWIAFIVGHAYYDYKKINEGTKPIYLMSFIIRGMAAIFHGILMDVENPHEWWPVLIFQITSFWIIFNPLLNILRGKSFFYLGYTSGWIDAILVKEPLLYKIAYIMSFFICVLSILTIYEANT